MQSIKENIKEIRTRIQSAAYESGRDPQEITLVGASKMNDAAACREAIAAGIDALGENKVQEMTQKLSENAYEGAPLHFIGHLQRNKVRQVVGKVDLIQSTGSYELLEAISKEAVRQGIIQNILLEVNIGHEAAKSGFMPEEIREAFLKAEEYAGVKVCGLMAIPPFDSTPEQNIAYLKAVKNIYDDVNTGICSGKLRILSMGMSADFEDAIRCGATMVRVGTSIFGHRSYAV